MFGTITTTVDLLGRVVSYVDVHGTRTDTSYDQAGRVASELVTPPNPLDAAQEIIYTNDDAGRIIRPAGSRRCRRGSGRWHRRPVSPVATR
jgi:YD repeat-containing protein